MATEVGGEIKQLLCVILLPIRVLTQTCTVNLWKAASLRHILQNLPWISRGYYDGVMYLQHTQNAQIGVYKYYSNNETIYVAMAMPEF